MIWRPAVMAGFYAGLIAGHFLGRVDPWLLVLWGGFSAAFLLLYFIEESR